MALKRIHKPRKMNFDFDIIPSVHIVYQKSMNNFWGITIAWLLWGITIRKSMKGE